MQPNQSYCNLGKLLTYVPHVGMGQSSYPFTSHLLLYLLIYFTFPILMRFIYFLAFPSLPRSTRIVPLCFQAGCCRRRLNLALGFLCVDFVLYVLFS